MEDQRATTLVVASKVLMRASVVEGPLVPQLLAWLIATTTVMVFGAGWRGFALPRLQSRHSALVSTLMLSVIWAAWHIPLFAFAPGLRRMGATDVVGWYSSIVTGAVFFTWIFNSTGGSIFIVAVFHGTMDIVFVSPGSVHLAAVVGAIVTCLGVAVLLVAGPRHLSLRGKITPLGVAEGTESARNT